MADLRIAGQEIDKQLSIIQQERETRTTNLSDLVSGMTKIKRWDKWELGYQQEYPDPKRDCHKNRR